MLEKTILYGIAITLYCGLMWKQGHTCSWLFATLDSVNELSLDLMFVKVNTTSELCIFYSKYPHQQNLKPIAPQKVSDLQLDFPIY